MRVIDRVSVPALIITAEDDPFVPAAPFRDPRVAGNRCIELHLLPHGGHCGFVGPRTSEDDGYWAENRIVDFVSSAKAPPQKRSLVACPRGTSENRPERTTQNRAADATAH
jgi:predicted alpha/beta-fold hydrolase